MNTTTSRLAYRLRTARDAWRALSRLTADEVEAFFAAYSVFELEQPGPETAGRVIDYYRVLNHLCALGNVEKMYIPPLLDRRVGVFANQLLYEQRIARELRIGAGDTVLDLGCGRGRIAAHLASASGARIVGLNVATDQLQSGREFADRSGLSRQLEFREWDFNRHPLPFADGTFDAAYQVQAFSYAQDLRAIGAEIHRVLKPGARLSCLDWVLYDAFDRSDSRHASVLKRTKALIGAVGTPTAAILAGSLAGAGFRIVASGDPSVGGRQGPLIEQESRHFGKVIRLVGVLARLRLAPAYFPALLDRFNSGIDAFIEGDRLGLFTTSFEVIAEKPAA